MMHLVALVARWRSRCRRPARGRSHRRQPRPRPTTVCCGCCSSTRPTSTPRTCRRARPSAISQPSSGPVRPDGRDPGDRPGLGLHQREPRDGRRASSSRRPAACCSTPSSGRPSRPSSAAEAATWASTTRAGRWARASTTSTRSTSVSWAPCPRVTPRTPRAAGPRRREGRRPPADAGPRRARSPAATSGTTGRSTPLPSCAPCSRPTSPPTGMGRQGTTHPITWCQQIDAGRSWYTGMGHEGTAYSEPYMRNQMRNGLAYAAGLLDGRLLAAGQGRAGFLERRHAVAGDAHQRGAHLRRQGPVLRQQGRPATPPRRTPSPATSRIYQGGQVEIDIWDPAEPRTMSMTRADLRAGIVENATYTDLFCSMQVQNPHNHSTMTVGGDDGLGENAPNDASDGRDELHDQQRAAERGAHELPPVVPHRHDDARRLHRRPGRQPARRPRRSGRPDARGLHPGRGRRAGSCLRGARSSATATPATARTAGGTPAPSWRRTTATSSTSAARRCSSSTPRATTVRASSRCAARCLLPSPTRATSATRSVPRPPPRCTAPARSCRSVAALGQRRRTRRCAGRLHRRHHRRHSRSGHHAPPSR